MANGSRVRVGRENQKKIYTRASFTVIVKISSKPSAICRFIHISTAIFSIHLTCRFVSKTQMYRKIAICHQKSTATHTRTHSHRLNPPSFAFYANTTCFHFSLLFFYVIVSHNLDCKSASHTHTSNKNNDGAAKKRRITF